MINLKKIAYNCRKATYLIEKKQLSRLGISEQMELRIHLKGCSSCRKFQQQSILINGRLREMFQNASTRDNKLDDDFKQDLKQLIEEKRSDSGTSSKK